MFCHAFDSSGEVSVNNCIEKIPVYFLLFYTNSLCYATEQKPADVIILCDNHNSTIQK